MGRNTCRFWTKIAFFVLFSVFFMACKSKKQYLTTGEYTHGLHLSTREDGIFYAWFAQDSIADSLHFAMLCIPHFPNADVGFWLPPHDKRSFFGVLTQLGQDSFLLKTDSLINNSPQAHSLHRGSLFTLKKIRNDWQHFYFPISSDTLSLYNSPSFSSKKRAIKPASRLYSDSLQGEWVRIQSDSGAFWLPRNVLY